MTVIPAKKTGIKYKNDTKCLKNAVKTAKKPILREKCAPISPISSPKREMNPKSLENLTRYEAGDILARLNGKKGSDTKALKAAMLNDNAKAAAEGNRIPQLIRDALAIADKKPQDALLKLTIAEKAAKISGALPEQSPDAKQKFELSGKLDNNLNVHIEKV
jgi:hypothetical protein